MGHWLPRLATLLLVAPLASAFSCAARPPAAASSARVGARAAVFVAEATASDILTVTPGALSHLAEMQQK